LRAFLAVPVGPPAHDPLAARIEALRQRVAGVRWVDTATTHVTLHFFAELPAEQVGAVVAAVRPIAARQAPFTVQPDRFGSFPGGPRARVLWVGLDDQADALAGLAARVQAAVGGCGFDVDPRPFQPHVTLGRPGPRFDPQAWRREVAEPLDLPPFTASEVILYESRNGHHVRERFLFGGLVARWAAPGQGGGQSS
jgi:2'-5' RNA ligase